MEKLTKEVDAILLERFGKDSIIALATMDAYQNLISGDKCSIPIQGTCSE